MDGCSLKQNVLHKEYTLLKLLKQNKMENSAVEWLVEQLKMLDMNSPIYGVIRDGLIEQAKQMEQSQKETIQMLKYDVEARDKYIALLESQLRIQDIAINRNV